VTMEDIKKKAEEGLRVLRDTAQDLAFNVEKQAKIGKRRYIDMSKVQRTIQGIYAEMGEYVYDEITAGRPVPTDAPYLAERIGAIERLRLEVHDIEDEIESIKKTEPPKHEEEQ
jgi:hypothetical protein